MNYVRLLIDRMGCVCSCLHRSRRILPIELEEYVSFHDTTSVLDDVRSRFASETIIMMVPKCYQKQLVDLREINNYVEVSHSAWKIEEQTLSEYADLLENPHLNITPCSRRISTEAENSVQVRVHQNLISSSYHGKKE